MQLACPIPIRDYPTVTLTYGGGGRLSFESAIESDPAPLAGNVTALLAAGVDVHCLRDLTRGRLASTPGSRGGRSPRRSRRLRDARVFRPSSRQTR